MAEQPELERLRKLVEQLNERVSRLEAALGTPPPAPQPPRPAVTASTPIPKVPKFEMLRPSRKPLRGAGEHDLESRIGSQWFNRVGIIAVLVGISYFLKYAFENNWIGPAGRVSVGLMAGFAIVIWSERFRKRGHQGFSLSLKAVGIGAIYLSLWATFQVYHLLPTGAAFAAMVVVTAATAILALTENAQVLAAFALVGGFATPILLSTGQNRELALFSYVALLDIGTLVLVVFRPWARLITGAFIGTLALYVGWYAEFYDRSQLGSTIAFASLFFVIFAAAPLLASVKSEQRPLPTLLLILPLLNAGAFFFELYGLLQDVSKPGLAWAAVGLAAVYLVLSRRLHARGDIDAESSRVLYLMHVALAVGFLTTAIPLKLETHWITIGWLVESAVLLWIGYRAASDFLKSLATAALVLGVARLLIMDNFRPQHLLLNARFATYVIAIAAIAWGASLAKKGGSATEQSLAAIGVVAINVLAIVTLSREVADYFSREVVSMMRTASARLEIADQAGHLDIARNFAFSALWMAYGAVLMWVGFRRRSAFLRWQAMVLLIVTIGKVFIYDTSRLERGYRIISFIALGVLLLAISFAYQRDWLKLSRHAEDEAKGTSAPS